jgi:8-oxo-dGTP pyrophosphatase MutT (NUDIX family)
MPLNYKVFFNDCMLSFSSPQDAPQGICHEFLQKPDRLVIAELIAEFEASGVRNYCLCHPDPHFLFRMFSSFFLKFDSAGGIVRDKSGRYLFIKRFGKWDIPKGKLEAGESPEMAAIREVTEECGIEPPTIIRSLPSTYHTYILDGQRVLKQTWWFAMEYSGSPATTPQKEEGITEAVWLKPSQFDIILENTYRSLEVLIGDINWE